MANEPAWKAANHAHWEEMVGLHLGPGGYDLAALRAGRGRLDAIEEAEVWPVDGKHVLHLQCHFGADSLTLAQRGATVVGLDFSPAAIAAARRLAKDLGLADRARFVQFCARSSVLRGRRAAPQGEVELATVAGRNAPTR